MCDAETRFLWCFGCEVVSAIASWPLKSKQDSWSPLAEKQYTACKHVGCMVIKVVYAYCCGDPSRLSV